METSKLVIRLTVLVMMRLAGFTQGLTHGWSAAPGEFPYIVRIVLFKYSELTETSRVSTGVLMTTTQILTTCDSVGFFNMDMVKLYDVSMVTIRGGTVNIGGGVIKNPTSSLVHPRCFFMRSGIVLFNFGMYVFDTPFSDGFSDNKLLSPLINVFESGRDMGRILKAMWLDFEQGNEPISRCQAAGWGYPIRVYEGQGEPDDFQAFSDQLQVTNMTVVSYDYCSIMTCKHFKDCLVSIWEYGWVCAHAPAGGGPCRNDKGSPLICGGQMFGILTNQQACTDEPIPRHFIRVDLAFDFVFGISGCSEFIQSIDVVVIAATVTTIKWLHAAGNP